MLLLFAYVYTHEAYPFWFCFGFVEAKRPVRFGTESRSVQFGSHDNPPISESSSWVKFQNCKHHIIFSRRRDQKNAQLGVFTDNWLPSHK